MEIHVCQKSPTITWRFQSWNLEIIHGERFCSCLIVTITGSTHRLIDRSVHTGNISRWNSQMLLCVHNCSCISRLRVSSLWNGGLRQSTDDRAWQSVTGARCVSLGTWLIVALQGEGHRSQLPLNVPLVIINVTSAIIIVSISHWHKECLNQPRIMFIITHFNLNPIKT